MYLSLKTTKPPAKVLTIFQRLYLWQILTAVGVPKRIQSQPEWPTQGRHNVMPARIVGGRLLLKHTDEAASSEAAGQHRIRLQNSPPNRMAVAVHGLFFSEVRPN